MNDPTLPTPIAATPSAFDAFVAAESRAARAFNARSLPTLGTLDTARAASGARSASAPSPSVPPTIDRSRPTCLRLPSRSASRLVKSAFPKALRAFFAWPSPVAAFNVGFSTSSFNRTRTTLSPGRTTLNAPYAASGIPADRTAVDATLPAAYGT